MAATTSRVATARTSGSGRARASCSGCRSFNSAAVADTLFACRRVHLGDVLPVHQMIEERLEVVWPAVAVVDVIRVLPNIAAENGRAAVDQRILTVGGLHHGDLGVLDGEPAPARPELGYPRLDEVLLHLGDRAEVGDDLLLQIARDLVAP